MHRGYWIVGASQEYGDMVLRGAHGPEPRALSPPVPRRVPLVGPSPPRGVETDHGDLHGQRFSMELRWILLVGWLLKWAWILVAMGGRR